MTNARIDTEPGNTLLTAPPPDYCPKGTGRWLRLQNGHDVGKKLFFYDRPGTTDRTIVFVHGNPECSYAFRKIAEVLFPDDRLRMVAMDHIGFGLSDQADFEMVDMHHAANLSELIATLDLQNVTLIVHDWGGPIGIGAFLEEPERVSNIVLLNTTVFPIHNQGLTFDNYPAPWPFCWSNTPNVIPDRLWGAHASFAFHVQPVSAARLVSRYGRFLIKELSGKNPVEPGSFEAVLRSPFGSRQNVRSSKRMVRQTSVWGHGYTYDDPSRGTQDNRPFYRRIQDRIGPLWAGKIGASLIFGEWDPLAKESVLRQWRNTLPQLDGNVHVVPGVSHFVEDAAPGMIADEIKRLAIL